MQLEGALMGETYFIKKKKESNYTQLDNTCVKDERLNWKEKGVHTYLMTLPPDWKIYISEIVKHSRDGKSAVYSAIQGLEKYGYIKRIRNRDENGRFENLVYVVYEEPSQADNDEPLPENPEMVKPNIEECNSDNQSVLTTDYLPNTNDIQKTDPTNSSSSPEDNTEKSVSESAFLTKIKELFSGEYPFDDNFEKDVKGNLSEHEISEECIRDYLSYVFDRTKLCQVQKSFEGLFRKLALASSIARDFRNSSYMKKPEDTKKIERKIKYVDCPICSTRFDEIENYCPNCSVSVQEINNPTQPSFIVRKKYYEMTNEAKLKYDAAYAEWGEKIKAQSGRSFFTENEKVQFWKDYGLID